MSRELCVHGASGHGRIVAEAARQCKYVIYFTDIKFSTCPTWQDLCIIAISDNKVRSTFVNYNLVTICHPTAIVEHAAVVRECDGIFVGAGAIIQIHAVIGRGAIINTGAIIEQNCCVGDWSHVCPGAVLGGGVEIGQGVLVGINAIILPGIKVVDWTTIGAGAVVLHDITEPGVYAGVPAKRLELHPEPIGDI